MSEASIPYTELESRLKACYSKSPLGITITNLNGKFLEANPKFEEMIGYTSSELLTMSIKDITYGDDFEYSQEQLKNLREGKIDSIEIEKRYTDKNGNIIFCNVSIVSHKDELGSPSFLMAMIKDISDQKKNEQRNLSIIDATTSVIWTVGRHGEILSEQLSWEKYTGQPWEEHRDFGYINKIHPEDQNKFLEDWKAAFRSVTNFVSQGRIWNNKQQNWHEFEVTGIPLREPNGEVREWVGFITDVSRQKKYENQLKQSAELFEKQAQELQQLNYITSHNLKSPITSIEGLINLLDTESLTEENIKIFNYMKHSTSVIKTSINRLGEVTAAKNNFSLPAKENSLSASYSEAKMGLQYLINKCDASITTNFTAVDNIMFPQIHLVCLLDNMLSNSLRYRNKSRRLEISLITHRDSDFDVLTIIDNGLGMDLDLIKDKLFRLYQRYHIDEEGTGVGLYLVKSLLENYGGRIEVESTLDIGTKFLLYFKRQ